MDLAGQTLLVTGASRGIGEAVARAAAAAGATVVLMARDVGALQRIADDIEAAGGPAPVLAPVNLEAATLADHEALAELLAARFGRLDAVLFNAAALGELAPLASYDPQLWPRVFQVNVHSVFLMIQSLLPLVLAAPRGTLLFTLAAEGLAAKPHWGAYGASKAALRALMEMLAQEHTNQPGFSAVGVVPPPTRTRLRFGAYPGEDRARLTAPADVAPAFLELLGPRGLAARGQVLRLTADGGLPA
ncbi:MAG: SDR family NAD(P)-dependent oxidoreductase [Gammaproteobacteria bacterium]